MTTENLHCRCSKWNTWAVFVTVLPITPIEKAKQLVATNHAFNRDAIIILKADHFFKGVDAWDALLSVGLNWGDGDLFHWNNAGNYGHDQYFSVWTTTSPGYLFPEHIKSGQLNPNDLVFGFSIPRSADPLNIFEIMIDAVTYCQQRLGGCIVDREGNAFDTKKEKEQLKELVTDMQKQGVIPGSLKALSRF